MLSPNVVRVLTLVSGVLGIVLGALNQFGLPVAVRSVVAAVGGTLLLVLAWLEHPTTQAKAAAK